MTLRIAMVGACPFPVPQGSQVYLADTARQVASRGHEVHLVVYGYGIGEAPSDMLVHRCARVPGQGKTAAGPAFAKPILDAAMVRTLRRVIDAHAIDLVHAHNYEGLAVALAAGKRPIIYHAHNAMADELPHYFRGARWAERFGGLLDRMLPKRADACLVPHDRLRDFLVASGCDESRVFVAPPAIDAARFPASETANPEPTVLYTGNLDRYQNLELLSAAMSRVIRTIPGARLCIATADPRPFPAHEWVLTETFEDVVQVLSRDVVVACPRTSWSGYPIKLLNAMAAGRAIVACAGAAYPLEHEVNGLVVPDDDAGAFADALVRLLTDPDLRTRLGAEARRTVAMRHTSTGVAWGIDAVYGKITDRPTTEVESLPTP